MGNFARYRLFAPNKSTIEEQFSTVFLEPLLGPARCQISSARLATVAQGRLAAFSALPESLESYYVIL